MSDTAVQFATNRRVHISLPVAQLAPAARFYATLLGCAPTKTRPGYARYEVAEPPLNLSIIESHRASGPADPISHFGIQVKSVRTVTEMTNRLKSAGLETRVEETVNCCHAVQSKVWVVDPDGNRWEVFVVLDDAPAGQHESAGTCCTSDAAETCCTTDAAETCCTTDAAETCCTTDAAETCCSVEDQTCCPEKVENERITV